MYIKQWTYPLYVKVCLGIALLFPSTADTCDNGDDAPDRLGPGDWLPIIARGLNGGDSVERVDDAMRCYLMRSS